MEQSFAGTLAFARLAIALVFAANAIHLSTFGMVTAILCAGLSYLAQFAYTGHAELGNTEQGVKYGKAGAALHAAALVAFLASLIAAVF